MGMAGWWSLGEEKHSLEPGAGSSTKPQRSDEEDVEMGDANDVASIVTFEETSPDGSPKTEVVALSDIIEDKEVLKAIMRNEIRTRFQSRGSRQIDTQSFVQHNHHLVQRDPEALLSWSMSSEN